MANPLPRSVAFQYNPDKVARTLRPRGGAAETGVGAGDAHRISGAPVETITMSVEIDAADQLEHGEETAGRTGIGAQLAALEMLLYPSSVDVLVGAALSLAGTIEILPPEAPLTVLVLGAVADRADSVGESVDRRAGVRPQPQSRYVPPSNFPPKY